VVADLAGDAGARVVAADGSYRAGQFVPISASPRPTARAERAAAGTVCAARVADMLSGGLTDSRLPESPTEDTALQAPYVWREGCAGGWGGEVCVSGSRAAAGAYG